MGLLSLCNSDIVSEQHALPAYLQIQMGNSGWICIAREKRVNLKLKTQPYSVSVSVVTHSINSRTASGYLSTKSGANLSLCSQYS